MENLIEEYSVRPHGHRQPSMVLKVAETYPMRLSDYILPRETDGYACFSVSTRPGVHRPDKTFLPHGLVKNHVND